LSAYKVIVKHTMTRWSYRSSAGPISELKTASTNLLAAMSTIYRLLRCQGPETMMWSRTVMIWRMLVSNLARPLGWALNPDPTGKRLRERKADDAVGVSAKRIVLSDRSMEAQ
ncbi:hypothetical protein KCU75_g56, partial [Aureobasidium melanogenum]